MTFAKKPERLWTIARAVAGTLTLALTGYLSYRFAQRLVSLLGPHGIEVVRPPLDFILPCLGIQVLWNSWSDVAGGVR